MIRRAIPLLAGLAVSVFFLWLTLRDVPLDRVLDSLRQANPGWIGLTLLIAAAGMWARAVRWRGLVGNQIAPLQAFHMINITALLNQLPLRAGEVARSLLARQAGLPLVTVATTIVVERLLDTLLVVFLLGAAVSRLPEIPPLATRSAILFSTGAVVGFVVLLGLAHRPDFARRVLTLTERVFPVLKRTPLQRMFNQVIDGLQTLTHWNTLAHAVGWTLISWGFSLATFYCLHLAMGITGVDLLASAMLSMALASFSVAIPVSIAAIGPFQAAVRLAGEAVNMPVIQATALGFLIHGVNVVGYTIWGTAGILSLNPFKAKEKILRL